MINRDLIVNQFKCLVRKALKNYRIDIYRKMKVRQDKEFVSDSFFDDMIICDDYEFLENMVDVMDFKMTVKNDLLYEILNSMEQQHRDIIYLSLCEEWSDRKIGETLSISRSKVQRIKQKLKKEIYDAMTGGLCNGNNKKWEKRFDL